METSMDERKVEAERLKLETDVRITGLTLDKYKRRHNAAVVALRNFERKHRPAPAVVSEGGPAEKSTKIKITSMHF